MDTVWPRKNDRLFKPGGYRSLATCIVSQEIRLIAVGYKEAADALVAELAHRGRDDSLVFPIVFSYRQALELQIKAIIELAATFEESGEEYRRTHDLSRLWRTLRRCISAEIEPEDRSRLDVVEECVLEFHAVDPSGDAFRYPKEAKLHQIDLGNFKAVMNRGFAFLDALADHWEDGVANKF